ncbi:hypothetical protein [Streptomonospora wellingtoniae]|uniref:DUF2269 family protein n=1 Tax=Streptomonospora wellingtoniae TaxID=3075544 RepID=A0ABU2KND0_9ACTN|nr:hypothetical protein [Streptomonospora sp. DSM 45055]MDT0300774.1 hypothetical protein [Streptomonospora sp. DSM 45055]
MFALVIVATSIMVFGISLLRCWVIGSNAVLLAAKERAGELSELEAARIRLAVLERALSIVRYVGMGMGAVLFLIIVGSAVTDLGAWAGVYAVVLLALMFASAVPFVVFSVKHARTKETIDSLS